MGCRQLNRWSDDFNQRATYLWLSNFVQCQRAKNICCKRHNSWLPTRFIKTLNHSEFFRRLFLTKYHVLIWVLHFTMLGSRHVVVSMLLLRCYFLKWPYRIKIIHIYNNHITCILRANVMKSAQCFKKMYTNVFGYHEILHWYQILLLIIV